MGILLAGTWDREDLQPMAHVELEEGLYPKIVLLLVCFLLEKGISLCWGLSTWVTCRSYLVRVCLIQNAAFPRPGCLGKGQESWQGVGGSVSLPRAAGMAPGAGQWGQDETFGMLWEGNRDLASG